MTPGRLARVDANVMGGVAGGFLRLAAAFLGGLGVRGDSSSDDDPSSGSFPESAPGCGSSSSSDSSSSSLPAMAGT